MNPEETATAFKKALTEFHEEQSDANADFFIPRREHYEHHTFLAGFMELIGITKKTALKAFIFLAVGGSVSVFGIGLVAYFLLKSKGLI